MNTDKNNASQTLFRLASLRSPQLTETKKENLGFIYRSEKDGMKGYFDHVLEQWSTADGITKFSALERASNNFEVPEEFKSDGNLEKEYPALSYLGKTINRREEISEGIISRAEAEWNIRTSGNSGSETVAVQKMLWDNLIYQTVTQQDFQIKEVIIQIIKAIHYLSADKLDKTEENRKINGDDFRAKAATAVIVFPEALVQHSAEGEREAPFTVNSSRIGNASIFYNTGRNLTALEKNQLASMADDEVKASGSLLRKAGLESLKNELERLHGEYKTIYETAYKEQHIAYEADIQPEIERYEKDFKDTEATFTPQTTEAEKEAAYGKISPLSIPEFSFKAPREIDLLVFKAKMNEESFALFLEMFTDYPEELKTYLAQHPDVESNIQVNSPVLAEIESYTLQLNPKYMTFGNIRSELDTGISEQFSNAAALKVSPERQYANIGGALVPFAETSGLSANSYYLRIVTESSIFFTKRGYLQFGFSVEDTSWSVGAVSVTIGTDMGNQEETRYNIPVSAGKIVIPSIWVRRFTNIGPVKIQIWFDNGCESKLEFVTLTRDTDITGTLTISKQQDSSDISTDTPIVFQPKHFGVKRLGIADYLKVEQSVHAYVPGEVSNIENVMASELRHKSSVSRDYSEVTTATSKTEETEKLSDTSKTSRTDMQTEVARQLDRQQSYDAHTRFGRSGTWYFEVGGSYATNNAKNESTRQAVSKSQEITEKALEKVLTKISEERVEKIIREFTETNVHEYDNRGKVMATNDPSTRPQHISGVYRWVDKKMKNQIYNYGKRMMFEFMVPEPARLHTLASKSIKPALTEPIDPRKANDLVVIRSYQDVTEDKLKYWLKLYPGLEIEFHALTRVVPFGKVIEQWERDGRGAHTAEFEIVVPDNYRLNTITGNVRVREGNSPATRRNMRSYTDIAGQTISTGGNRNDWPINLDYSNTGDITGAIPVRNDSWDILSFNYSMILECSLIPSFLEAWKIKSFNSLIAAYQAAYEGFVEKQAEINAMAAEKERENNEKAAVFYRSTESNVLKHNCIAYLLKNYNALGLEMSVDNGQDMKSFSMKFGDNLDQYTALAKFLEQAFEWTIMDYTFYPYYWANKNHWQDLYLSEELNPLFRSFLQAGMARVIVTVTPGFEDAVQFFMNTGRIWNGGEVPVIGDPLYLSIVDEMRQPMGIAQGKYWITRVPTTLTILQAKSAGLEVLDALPIFPEDKPENCENPEELETISAFGQPVDAIMQSSAGTTSTLG